MSERDGLLQDALFDMGKVEQQLEDRTAQLSQAESLNKLLQRKQATLEAKLHTAQFQIMSLIGAFNNSNQSTGD